MRPDSWSVGETRVENDDREDEIWIDILHEPTTAVNE
jgi:hypothetical protein